MIKMNEQKSEIKKLIKKFENFTNASADPSLNTKIEKTPNLINEPKSGFKEFNSHGDVQSSNTCELQLPSEMLHYHWLTSMTYDDSKTVTAFTDEDLADYKFKNCTEIKKEVPTDINLVLIGKTGNGKSATGNSILRGNAFCAKSSMESVTKNIQKECTRFQGKTINVFDTPGIHDNRMDSKGDLDEFQAKVASAFQFYPQGFHAFLMVIRYGNRFTEEDKVTINFMKQTFGSDFVKNHVILVVTCGDNFNQAENNKSFNQWCNEQTDESFTSLLQECENRAVLFDNTTKDDKIKHLQLACIMNLVEHLCLRNCRYTNVHLDHAVVKRDRLTVEAKKSVICDNMMLMARTEDIEKAKHITTVDRQQRVFIRQMNDSKNLMYRKIPTDIDLLLIGRTGNGKSATGNSILGESVFIAGDSTKSVTKKTAFAHSEVYGKTIKVVDAHGIGNTSCSTEEGRAMIKSCIQEAINSNTRGYHAILLVLKFGDRLTKEELETIEFLKEDFGIDVFNRHGIIILTRGDKFDLRINAFFSFSDWCKQQTGDFSKLLEEFQNRIILFDNVTKNEGKICSQIASLILMVEHVCSREYRYTNQQFNDAREKEERLKIENKRPQLSEYWMVECSKIKTNLMYSRMVEDLEERIRLLSKLTDTITKLKQKFKEDDAGTNVFQDMMDDAQSLLNVVNEEKNICIALKKEREHAATYTAKRNKERNEEIVAQKAFLDANREDLENEFKKIDYKNLALLKELETRKKSICLVM